MVTTAATVTNTTSKIVELHVKYSTTNEHNPPEATTAVVGVLVNLRMVTTVVTITTHKQIVGVLLDRGHNRHLVFVTKDEPVLSPYLKRLVPQLWNTLNGISQKR
jgi:hypothetical protein